jgi:hypothetical protein
MRGYSFAIMFFIRPAMMVRGGSVFGQGEELDLQQLVCADPDALPPGQAVASTPRADPRFPAMRNVGSCQIKRRLIERSHVERCLPR